jgi:tetratricopeptide (TPR) repeat protein
MMALIIGAITSATAQAQSETFTISGQVSFFSGRPAARMLVKLNTRAGMVREAFTNDQGRFEFTEIHGGVFTLMASNPADPSQKSEVVERETPNRVLTDHIYVNLTLGEAGPAKSSKPGVITVDEAERKVPKAAQKAFRQGLIFKDDNDLIKALESFSQAIALYPEYVRALVERGDIYIAQRKLDQAAAEFQRATKINGRDGPALRGSGYCKLEKQEFFEAVELFEKSISADPNNANTHLLLGIANLELDRREPARDALQKALSFDTQPVPRAHIYLANLYARERQYLQAADELHKYIEAEPMAAEASGLREVEAKWRARATAP